MQLFSFPFCPEVLVISFCSHTQVLPSTYLEPLAEFPFSTPNHSYAQ